MARNYDKTYLDGLIAKAKKSWEGVDVESYMSDLRDDSFDKEVAENLSKEVASYITEQMKSNMDKVTIRCRDLMVGDWITNRNGLPMQITNVGEDYAYATFEGNEGDPWEFDDKIEPPYPILLTREIFEKNGFEVDDKAIWRIEVGVRCSYSKKFGEDFMCYSVDIEEMEEGGWFDFGIDCCLWQGVAINYVHELQHALRLAGMTDMANNFKI